MGKLVVVGDKDSAQDEFLVIDPDNDKSIKCSVADLTDGRLRFA